MLQLRADTFTPHGQSKTAVQQVDELVTTQGCIPNTFTLVDSQTRPIFIECEKVSSLDFQKLCRIILLYFSSETVYS